MQIILSLISLFCLFSDSFASAVAPREDTLLDGEMSSVPLTRGAVKSDESAIARVGHLYGGVTLANDAHLRLAKWAASGHKDLSASLFSVQFDRDEAFVLFLGRGIFLTTTSLAHGFKAAAEAGTLMIQRQPYSRFAMMQDPRSEIALVRIDTDKPIEGGYTKDFESFDGGNARVLVRGGANYFHESGMFCLCGYETVVCEHDVAPHAGGGWDSAAPVVYDVDRPHYLLTKMVPSLIYHCDGALLLGKSGLVAGLLTYAGKDGDRFVHHFDPINSDWVREQREALVALPTDACIMPKTASHQCMSCCAVA